MSQRTRSHTTGATAKTAATAPESPLSTPVRHRKDKRAAPHAEPESEQMTLAPDALVRVLRAVATELERDPALAQRVTDAMAGSSTTPLDPPITPEPKSATGDAGTSRAFRPRLVTGAPPELGPGIPDPFALRKRLGKEGLRAALADLRLGSLRAIVREYRLDPGSKISKLNDAEKLRALILAATN